MGARRIAATAVLAGVAFVPPPGGAAEETRRDGNGAEGVSRPLDSRRAIVEPDRRSPLLRTGKPERVTAAAHTGACDAFYRLVERSSGDALVSALRSADLHCIDDLEWIGDRPEVQFAASSQDRVVSVARAIPGLMPSYANGNRPKQEVYALFLYLRKVRDIHHWCRERKTCGGAVWENAEAYPLEAGSLAGEAVRGAFDAFVAHPLFMSRGQQHGIVLDCVAVAMLEFPLQELYLHVIARWLNAWDDGYASSEVFRDAMERILDIAYWGHSRREKFGPRFGGDDALFDALRDFVLDPAWLGSRSQRIMERAALEVARFSLYPGTANYGRLPPAVRSIRDRYEGGDHEKTILLRVVGEIHVGDPANCARYGLCDWYAGGGFEARFRRELFSERRSCTVNFCAGDTVAVHSQDLDADELGAACRRLNDHSRAFASMFETRCTPVPNDANAHLDFFVFTDGASCEDMEWAAGFFDSCSGIFYEGEPDAPGSVSVLTEKEPGDPLIDPELAIWNFEHEYAHHLDGRYNRYGGYSDDPAHHGWIEGIAEYFANTVTEYHHGKGYCESTHSLTDTMLRSGSIPTSYNQRHIAIRFLMENWRPFVDRILPLMRQGRYDEFKAYTARQIPRVETAWETWIESGCVNASVPALPSPPPPEPPPDPDPDPDPPEPEPPVTGPCEPGAETVCLRDGRFEVRAEWWTDGQTPAAARTVDLGADDSGLFFFLDETNWEILVKVLDGCAINGHVWVFGASTTDLGYSIRVRDSVSGAVREYRNEPGQPSPAITDGEAFADSCRP